MLPFEYLGCFSVDTSFFHKTRSSYPIEGHLPFWESDENGRPYVPRCAHSLRWLMDSRSSSHTQSWRDPSHTPVSGSSMDLLSSLRLWVNGMWAWIAPHHCPGGWPAATWMPPLPGSSLHSVAVHNCSLGSSHWSLWHCWASDNPLWEMCFASFPSPWQVSSHPRVIFTFSGRAWPIHASLGSATSLG